MDDMMTTPPPGFDPEKQPPAAPAAEKYVLTKKFEIEEELKIYFMGIVANPMMPFNGTIRNKNVGVIAYNHGAALKKAMEVWGAGGGIAVNAHDEDFINVRDILKVVNHEGVVIQDVVPEPEKSKLMAKKKFKLSLLMASEEYVKDEADKVTLKRIIAAI